MSQTSYQAAPPRISIVAEQQPGVKFCPKHLAYLVPPDGDEAAAAGAGAAGSLISMAQRGNA